MHARVQNYRYDTTRSSVIKAKYLCCWFFDRKLGKWKSESRYGYIANIISEGCCMKAAHARNHNVNSISISFWHSDILVKMSWFRFRCRFYEVFSTLPDIPYTMNILFIYHAKIGFSREYFAMLIKVDFAKTLKHIYLKHKMIMLREQKHTAFTRKIQLFSSEKEIRIFVHSARLHISDAWKYWYYTKCRMNDSIFPESAVSRIQATNGKKIDA